MKHLTVDEIIEFVSLTEYNDEAIKLSSAVNSHIRNCRECLELVRAFQTIYDEFIDMGKNGDFKKYVCNAVLHTKKAEDKKSVCEDLEGFK